MITGKLKTITDDFINRLQNLFGAGLSGVYLTGSAALGGYRDGRSDIDFTVVLKDPPTDKQAAGLKVLHEEMRKKFPGNILEGHYVTAGSLGKEPYETKPVAAWHKGKLSYSYHGISAVTWYTLKRYGVTVFGPLPETLPFDLREEKLVKYTIDNVNSYWAGWLADIKKLSVRSLFALTGAGIEWGVLGISRMFYTLSERDVTSKDAVTEYALSRTPEKFGKILKEAQRIRLGLKSRYCSPLRRRRDMIDYFEYMIGECRRAI